MTARRTFRQTAFTEGRPPAVPPREPASEVLTYKGYRIRPESYAVHTSAWSPRVVVCPTSQEGWGQGQPLYATNAARYATQAEANRHAVDVARAWIDTAVEAPAP
jgi:hypothetical protein